MMADSYKMYIVGRSKLLSIPQWLRNVRALASRCALSMYEDMHEVVCVLRFQLLGSVPGSCSSGRAGVLAAILPPLTRFDAVSRSAFGERDSVLEQI